MNRLLSFAVALAAVIWLFSSPDRCATAGSYLVQRVSDFKFARSPGGGLDFIEPWQIGNQLFFRSASSNGMELYRTDGNTVTEFDLNPGAGPFSAPTWFHIWRNTLYFDAFSNALGWEPYSTSGGPPTLVADIAPGPESSGAGHGSGYAVLGDYLYFFANANGTPGLYRTSGVGVEYVARASNDAPHIFKLYNNALVFSGSGENGDEPYCTDGQTVSQLADINPGPASSNLQSLFEYAGQLYFHATGPDGSELFRTDGNSVTELDINPGVASSNPIGGTIFKNYLYFTAMRNNGYDLLKTNANNVSNVTEFNINPRPGSSVPQIVGIVGDRLYFTATGLHGTELFNTDGSSVKEFDINPGSGSSNPLFFKTTSDSLYFSAQGPQGTELYKVRGDNVMLIDLNPGPASSNPSPTSLAEFNGSVYLAAFGPSGVELFSVTGTNVTAFDFFPGTTGSYPKTFIEFNGDLFFSAVGPNGRAIYRIHGTTTEEIFNREPHTPPSIGIDSRITGFVLFEGSLLFIAETSEGAHLYRLNIIVPEPTTLLPLLLVIIANHCRRRSLFDFSIDALY